MRVYGVLGMIGLSLLLAGCVGGSGLGALVGTLVVAVALFLQACESAPAEPKQDAQVTDVETKKDAVEGDTTGDAGADVGECDGNWETACEDGQAVQVCCPGGMICNYGMGVQWCDDGSCKNYPETCDAEDVVEGDADAWDAADVAVPDVQQDTSEPGDVGPDVSHDVPGDVDECSGYWETGCVDGQPVELCCPEGMACNYGMGLQLCGDGTCVNYPDECPKEDECDGTWENACVDGQVTPMCCPEGMACNYGMTLVDCGDGTCVSYPDECPKDDECDGYWGEICTDGHWQPACCPEGAVCNFGMLAQDCGDGTCVNMPEECPGEETCDGTWEEGCSNGKLTWLCCPEGMACNYGMNLQYCGGDTCSYFECPADPKDECPGGSWDPICDNGQITTTCCPEGMICNYLPFTDCGDGTCAPAGQTCKAEQ